MGLSLKPLGGFCSFLAGKLISSGEDHMQKLVKTGARHDLLEGFFFTMATVNHCHGNRSRHVFSVPNHGIPAKFGARRSVNGGGVSGQTHTVTLLVL